MNIWGNVPAYFGGVALILTVIILFRDRNEKVRYQADRLAAWVERSKEDGKPHRVLIRNASDLPCMDISYSITEGYKNPSGIRFSKTFGADTNWWRKPRYIHAIGPGETIVAYETTEDVAVRQISFTDSAGRHWKRTGTHLARRKRLRLLRVRRLIWAHTRRWPGLRKLIWPLIRPR